jgi:hypothetical protein
MAESPSVAASPDNDSRPSLVMTVPGDEAFVSVVLTACRVFTAALPGGGELFERLEPELAELAAAVLDGDGDPVEVELGYRPPRLEVSLRGDRVELPEAGPIGRAESLEDGGGIRLSWQLEG